MIMVTIIVYYIMICHHDDNNNYDDDDNVALDRLSMGGSAWSDTGGPSVELSVEATDVLGNLALA